MILLAFTYFFIPETRDRTLEEIHEMFEAKVPARKFKKYVCTRTEAFAAEGIAHDIKLQETGGTEHVEATEKGDTKAQTAQV